MLKVFKRRRGRKGVSTLRDYFRGDWGDKQGIPPMWDALAPHGLDLTPQHSLIGPGDGKLSWYPLPQKDFDKYLKEIESAREDDSHLIALEIALAPPKSFSLAALCGDSISGELLAIHQQAASSIWWLLRPWIRTRQTRQGSVFWEPMETFVFRFTHPWNRCLEPQLHEHQLLFCRGRREDGKTRALDTVPILSHILACRAMYHYSLVSGLQRAGIQIRRGPPGTLLWELEDVTQSQLEKFQMRVDGIRDRTAILSERYSCSKLMQIAALETRRELPKTDPATSLNAIRKDWLEKIGEPISLRRGPSIAGEIDSVLNLGVYFRRGAIQTKESLLGWILAEKLGSIQGADLWMRDLHLELEKGAIGGKIIPWAAGGRELLVHVPTYLAEERILRHRALRARQIDLNKITFGSGSTPADQLARRKILKVLAQPRALRILATPTRLPTFEISSGCLPRVVSMGKWDPIELVGILKQYPNGSLIVTVSEDPYAHDFLASLGKRVRGRLPSIESMTRAAKFSLGRTRLHVLERSDFQKSWLQKLDRGRRPALLLLAEPRPPLDTGLVEFAREWEATRLDKGHPVIVRCIRNLAYSLDADQKLDGVDGVYLLRRYGEIPRHRFVQWKSAWEEASGDEGYLHWEEERQAASTAEYCQLISMADGSGAAFFATLSQVTLKPGAQMQLSMDLFLNGKHFKEGEIVYVDECVNDHTLRLVDGRTISRKYLPCAPTIIAHSLGVKRSGANVVVVVGTPTVQRLDGCHGCGHLVFLVPQQEIDQANRTIAEWLRARLGRPSHAGRSGSSSDAPGFFPSRKFWREHLPDLAKTAARIPVEIPWWLKLKLFQQQNLRIIRRRNAALAGERTTAVELWPEL